FRPRCESERVPCTLVSPSAHAVTTAGGPLIYRVTEIPGKPPCRGGEIWQIIGKMPVHRCPRTHAPGGNVARAAPRPRPVILGRCLVFAPYQVASFPRSAWECCLGRSRA